MPLNTVCRAIARLLSSPGGALIYFISLVPSASSSDLGGFACEEDQYCRSRSMTSILYGSRGGSGPTLPAGTAVSCLRFQPGGWLWAAVCLAHPGTHRHAMFKACVLKHRPPFPPPPPPPPPFDAFALNNWDPTCSNKCCGNDSRCAGAPKYQCDAWHARGCRLLLGCGLVKQRLRWQR